VTSAGVAVQDIPGFLDEASVHRLREFTIDEAACAWVPATSEAHDRLGARVVVGIVGASRQGLDGGRVIRSALGQAEGRPIADIVIRVSTQASQDLEAGSSRSNTRAWPMKYTSAPSSLCDAGCRVNASAADALPAALSEPHI
jgi:hypothetical protein